MAPFYMYGGKGIAFFILFLIILVYLVLMFRQNLDTSGGILNQEVHLNPISLFVNSLTESTAFTLLTLIFTGLISNVLVYLIFDSRGVKVKRYSDSKEMKEDPYHTYGRDGFMTEKEKNERFDLRDFGDPKGFILGVDTETGKLITVPHVGGSINNNNVILFGNIGMRKTTGVLTPNILSIIASGFSLVVWDPKGDLYTATKPAAVKQGYSVKLFDINAHEFNNSDGWDALRMVRESHSPQIMAQKMTQLIVDNLGAGKEFWNDANKNCLTLAILYVALSKSFMPTFSDVEGDDASTIKAEPGDDPWIKHRTLGEVYLLIANVGGDMKDKIEAAMADYPEEKSFLEAPYKTWNKGTQVDQVQSGLATKLSILQSKEVRRALSTDEIRFEELNEHKTIIYVRCSDQDDTFKMVSTLFATFLFDRMVEVADHSPGKKLKIPLYMIMEEADNIGRIPALGRKVSTIRSRNINLMMCYQTLGQLTDTYSGEVIEGGGQKKHEWEVIMAGCAIKLCLGCDDETTKEYFSRRSGKGSGLMPQVTEHLPKYSPFKFTTSQSVRETPTEVPVLTPSDVGKIQPDQILICPPYGNVALETKYRDINHPLYHCKLYNPETKEYIECNTFNHIPKWREERDGKVDPESNCISVLTPKEIVQRVSRTEGKPFSEYVKKD